MLEEIGTLITQINNAIEQSAKMTGNKSGAGDLIGTKDAIKLLNETGELGTFEAGENGTIKVNGKEYSNWLHYNSEFINAIDNAVANYSQAELDSDDRTKWGERLKELFKHYSLFKEIVSRIYDPTSLSTLDLG
jgi:hypothetical protein